MKYSSKFFEQTLPLFLLVFSMGYQSSFAKQMDADRAKRKTNTENLTPGEIMAGSAGAIGVGEYFIRKKLGDPISIETDIRAQNLQKMQLKLAIDMTMGAEELVGDVDKYYDKLVAKGLNLTKREYEEKYDELVTSEKMKMIDYIRTEAEELRKSIMDNPVIGEGKFVYDPRESVLAGLKEELDWIRQGLVHLGAEKEDLIHSTSYYRSYSNLLYFGERSRFLRDRIARGQELESEIRKVTEEIESKPASTFQGLISHGSSAENSILKSNMRTRIAKALIRASQVLAGLTLAGTALAYATSSSDAKERQVVQERTGFSKKNPDTLQARFAQQKPNEEEKATAAR